MEAPQPSTRRFPQRSYRADANLRSLHWWARQMPRKTTILFLGDNIYEDGLPVEDSKGYEEAERRLWAQLGVVKASGAHGIFIPGNHDWADGKKGGWAAVLRQEQYVNEALGRVEPSFLPRGGRPGPEKVDQDGLRIIALDSQWWLHRDDDKPTGTRVTERLRGLLQERGGREAIVVAHHPLATHGSHGGFFDWRDHLFPLASIVGRGAGTLFAHEHLGFMAVDFLKDGTVLLRVIEPGGRGTAGRVGSPGG